MSGNGHDLRDRILRMISTALGLIGTLMLAVSVFTVHHSLLTPHGLMHAKVHVRLAWERKVMIGSLVLISVSFLLSLIADVFELERIFGSDDSQSS